MQTNRQVKYIMMFVIRYTGAEYHSISLYRPPSVSLPLSCILFTVTKFVSIHVKMVNTLKPNNSLTHLAVDSVRCSLLMWHFAIHSSLVLAVMAHKWLARSLLCNSLEVKWHSFTHKWFSFSFLMLYRPPAPCCKWLRTSHCPLQNGGHVHIIVTMMMRSYV